MRTTDTSPLDPATLTALYEFRAKTGEVWKEKLLTAWMRASEPGLLQRLRNERGPSWLAQYELPEGTPEAPKRKLDLKESSRLLKQRLQKTFPGTAFSVRLARGTSYGCVDVSWSGPSFEDVERITDTFQGRSFDGTDDSTVFLKTAVETARGELVESGLGMVMLRRERDEQEVL